MCILERDGQISIGGGIYLKNEKALKALTDKIITDST